jgi:hypothetical protein
MSVLILAESTDAVAGFLSFDDEVKRASTSFKCVGGKITPEDAYLGALYGCIVGKAETVKLFINGVRGTKRVLNVKMMWNDWYKDVGYGIHADKNEARRFVIALADTYAPPLKEQLVSTFFGNQQRVLKYKDLRFEYRLTRGPAIDEHLVVVTEK